MTLTVEQALQQGIAAHKAGKLQEAEQLYRAILQIQPDHPDTNHNLGLIAISANQIEAALSLLRTALEIQPRTEQFWLSYIDALIRLNQFAAADAVLQQAESLDMAAEKLESLRKRLKPRENSSPHSEAVDAEVYRSLGVTLKELDRLEEAEASYKKAIALKPDYYEAHFNLGNTLKAQDKLDDAEQSYGQAIALKPDFTPALMNRWELLFNRGEYEAALNDSDHCNNPIARLYSLECLYELGRIEEIYQRIANNSVVDDTNIHVAAFAAFIAGAENKNTAHNFCNNPLDFISVSNLSDHLDDVDSFTQETIAELRTVSAEWEPAKKSTYKGFQTPDNINLFATPSGNFLQLKSIIDAELDSYVGKFQGETCSYIQKWPIGKNLFGWHVILKQQGHQTPHIHASGWLSGVIYLQVVPSRDNNEGAIEFSLNSTRCSRDDLPTVVHQPQPGDIVFFPSSLHHRTIPFSTDTDRIVIAFDLLPVPAST